MKNVFSSLFVLIRNKFGMFFTTLALWLNPKTLFLRLKSFFLSKMLKFLDVKPKNQRDYYTIAKWQVSKKLAYFIVLGVGLASAVYIIIMASSYLSSKGGDNLRVYKYNNVLLKFAEGEVGIKGKSNYLAYTGQVKDGKCNGAGSLYRPDGSLVYEGNFTNSMFEEDGKEYFESGVLAYEGKFHENLYSGEGTQYRKNGSVLYKGNFSEGLKDGYGQLCNSGSNPIFSGLFSKDNIVYNELLDKSVKDVAECYTGKTDYYESDDAFFVYMKEIDGIYAGALESDAADDEMKVGIVYVLSNVFSNGNVTANSIEELIEYYGEPLYEGYADIDLGEALAVNIQSSKGLDYYGKTVNIEKDVQYSDYIKVTGFDSTKQVYLYGFSLDGVLYTFVCEKPNGPVVFYYEQLLEEEE